MKKAIRNYLSETQINPNDVQEKGFISIKQTFIAQKIMSDLDEVLSKTFYKILGLNIFDSEVVETDISQMAGAEILRSDGTYSKTRLETPARYYVNEYDYVLVKETEVDTMTAQKTENYYLYEK